MLWVKAFHIIFLVTWFAGLFYLPRLFVYHASSEDSLSRRRFMVMERRLFVIMTIGGVVATFFGLWLLIAYSWRVHGEAGWLHAKLALALVLILYHGYCYKLMRDFRAGANRHGERFYRWLNEVPTVLLIAMVILVVVKPF